MIMSMSLGLDSAMMIEVQANRASALFRQAADTLNQLVSADSSETSDAQIFSYWCKFYGENPDEREDSIKLVESKIYNTLESKGTVSKLLKQHDILDVFPATFLDVQAAIAHPAPVAIWFVKPFHLSGGRDIQVVSAADLPNFELPKFNLIQAGVEDIQLIDGKKFTARIYLLLWNQQVYLFDDGFAMIHAPQYQKASTDYSIQVDHRGYDKAESAVKVTLASEVPGFDAMMSKAKAAAVRIMPILAGAIAATSSKRYLLLGIDLLPLENGEVKFIEINAIPNFIHSKKVNQTLNVPFFEHTMRVIYGLGSDRLTSLTHHKPIEPIAVRSAAN
ncbi:MAG: hypothetical protein WBA76_22225 [Phormidesmis sp.]